MSDLLELKKQKEALEMHTPVLIQHASAFAKLLEAKDKPPGRTQFSGLVTAGQKASCVEEIALFIRYKEAKKGSGNWAGLAKPLVQHMEEVRGLAEPKLQLALVRRFLGYVMWAAYTCKGVK